MAFWPKADTGNQTEAANGKPNGSGAKSAPSPLSRIEPLGEKSSSKPVKAAAPAQPQAEQPVPPEIAAKIGELRNKIQLSIGQIVLSVMNLPRYKHQSLADLSHILIEPLLRDRVAIAHKQIKAADGTISIDEESVAGIAIWATVSDAVDAKITEQIRAGAFPVRLGVDDWTSGENVWLLDVVAGDRKQATSVLANFRQLAGDKPVKIHPIIGRLIDPAVLEKLRGAEQADALAAKPAAGRA
jgi:cytolysin-activating lysine-acyltransferase